MRGIIFALLLATTQWGVPATNGIPDVTVDGNDWHGIQRVYVGKDGRIVIMASGGGTTTTEEKLPPGFLESWGITTDSVESAKTKRKEKARDDVEKAIRSGVFREVGGIVYDTRKLPPGWARFYNAKVIQVLDDGVILNISPDKYRVIGAFVRNLPPTLSDTDTVSFTGMLTGSYSYINKVGDDRTIKAFDVGQPCTKADIPDAILKDGKPYAKIAVGGKASDKTATLPDSGRISGAGSGFFITEDGYLVTNAHVVEDATSVKVRTKQGVREAVVVGLDRETDLALLKVSGKFKALPIADSRSVVLGDAVFTIGFPNIQLQGLEPKYTDGKVSALSGLHDDPLRYQVSIPVQPGNSGGPLVDSNGNVIGVIVSRLSDLAVLRASGSLPQNVNYAIKAKLIRGLLDKHPEAKLTTPVVLLGREEAVKSVEDSVAMILTY